MPINQNYHEERDSTYTYLYVDIYGMSQYAGQDLFGEDPHTAQVAEQLWPLWQLCGMRCMQLKSLQLVWGLLQLRIGQTMRFVKCNSSCRTSSVAKQTGG